MLRDPHSSSCIGIRGLLGPFRGIIMKVLTPRTLKIEPYSIYDILVIMCVVRLLSSYIFVDFSIKWLYYCQL